MNENIFNLCSQILNILNQNLYSISSARLYNLEQLAKNTVVYYTNESGCNINVALYNTENNHCGSFITKNIPQVIDVPPIYQNNHLQNILPILILKKEDRNTINWTTIHELCHLFSIGSYTYSIKTENIKSINIKHNFGINEYVYHIDEKGTNLISFTENNCINELINDFVTLCFMQILCNKKIKPPYNGIERFKNYIENCCSIQHSDIISWYFTGDTARLKDCLLNEENKNYEALNNKLEIS